MLSGEERKEIEMKLTDYPNKQAMSIESMLIVQRHRGWVSDESLRDLSELLGFSVLEAEDGQAGAEAFARNASEIALVIVDMTMPKMSGDETFRAIRSVRGDVPVMLTSGYNEVEATRRFSDIGLAGFIEKPFTPADLAGKLAKILGPM